MAVSVSTRFVPQDFMVGLSRYPDSWQDLPEEKAEKPQLKPKQKEMKSKATKPSIRTPAPPTTIVFSAEDFIEL